MKYLLVGILLCIPFFLRAESVNGSCLIGDSDYVEADFFYNINLKKSDISGGIITIANGSETPLVSLNIEITAQADGEAITIYQEFKKFNPPISGYTTFKIDGITFRNNKSLSNIKISISNPRCSLN